MIESIAANNIHEKQLAPHLRKKIRGVGQSVTYASTTIINNETEPAIFKAIAGEALTAYRFGYILDDKVYIAGLNFDKPANCFILTSGNAEDEIEIAYSDIEIEIEDLGLIGIPYLTNNGGITDVEPEEKFIQILGYRISEDKFYLKIHEPLWFEID